ncbi:unnamed protein product, partial [Discosporangium mesarthrocarpum]
MGGSEERESQQKGEAALHAILDANLTLESAQFEGGGTALHHAARRNDLVLVRLLLDRGVSKAHVKDFRGRRASDLTRNLACLRLLGALKRAPAPTAVKPQVESTNPELAVVTGPRVVACVNFSIAFYRSGSTTVVNKPTTHGCHGENGVEQKQEREGKRVKEVRGIAKQFDMQSKALYISEVLSITTTPAAETNVGMDVSTGNREGGECRDSKSREERSCEGTEVCEKSLIPNGKSCRLYIRSVLDVKLLECLSPRGQELFTQLNDFVWRWKHTAVRTVIEDAIEEAA